MHPLALCTADSWPALPREAANRPSAILASPFHGHTHWQCPCRRSTAEGADLEPVRAMARGAAAMMVSQVVTWTATLVLTIALARVLGAGDYGKLQFLLSLMALFVVFVDLGTGTLVTREIARDRRQAAALLTNTLLLKSVTAVAAYVAFVATVALLRRPAEMVHLAAILGAGMVLLSFSGFLNSVLQGLEQVPRQAWGDALHKATRAVWVVALLAAGHRLVPVAWAMVGASALQTLWSGYWVLRSVRPRWRLASPHSLRGLVTASLPFSLYAVFARVYDKIDVALLEVMAGHRVVGWYTAAYTLFQTLYFLAFILSTVAFPVLSRLWATDRAAYRGAVHRGFALLAAAGIGLSVTIFVLAGPVVDRLYSHAEFPGTAPALRILALALLCQYLGTMVVMVLQTTDRQASWTKAGALAALANPAVNYLLIPPLGHLGAAITTVLTEAMLLALALRACPPGIFDRSDLRVLVRALAAGALLAAGMAAGLRWGMIPAALLGMPLYLLMLVRLRVIAEKDLALGKALLRGMKREA